jgi:cytoskeleton protein RodZ
MSEAASNDLPEAEPHPNPAPATRLTLGAQLATARAAHEWSIEHVASQLNLAPRQIQALEADNYGALPGMASVRGFVRAYAKLLKVDADPLVALIASEQVVPAPQLEPKRSVSSAPFSDNRSLSSGHRRNSPKTILAGLVVVLLAVGAFNIERMGGWPVVSQSLSGKFKDTDTNSTTAASASASANAQSEASASTKSDSVVEPLPSPQATSDVAGVAPAAKTQDLKPKSDALNTKDEVKAPVVTDKADKPTPPDAKPVVQNAKPAALVAAVPATDSNASKPIVPKPIAADVKNVLVFNVRKDSWIEVRDAHNVLLSRMVKAGSTEQLDVTQPVSLIVGNAAGVDIVFRGTPVETKTDAKSNVARLSLK